MGWRLTLTLVVASGLPVCAKVDYKTQIAPIFQQNCSGCHGADKQMGGLRLDQPGTIEAVIQPGDSGNSRLFQLVSAGVKGLTMPPGRRLAASEIGLLRQWIDEGAEGMQAAPGTRQAKPIPWSFRPIGKPVPPAADAWSRNTIDRFIGARLRKEAIQPAAEADRWTLARRVFLDLTGLPPTPAQAQAFVADRRPDAYERLVDQLLESPHYGEKWARPWLDLARYSDSEGGVQDYFRPFAWRYREWVIQAFNRDMGFDQFTIEQMAGDLLPGSTMEQKIATGFHRNTVTSREGGISLEKLRYEQLVDRTNTVGTVWLGLTVGCAQCHDHKYDPISQKDYYSLMAYFENTEEVDLDAPLDGEIGAYRRTLGEYRSKRQKLLSDYAIAPHLADWEKNLRQTGQEPGKRTNWDAVYDSLGKLLDRAYAILAKTSSQRTEREQEQWEDHFIRYSSGILGSKRYGELKFKELYDKLAALRKEYPALSRVLALEESDGRRPTFVRLRGDYQAHGAKVAPAAPAALASGPLANRLALGQWLVAKENPLTARVLVNRMWQELFGRGLVRTSEDFGMQGEKPTHPELLDWLAADLMDNGWKMKRIVRLMVTSATYRQSSAVRPELAIKDPQNTLLARQNRVRLAAEWIRDAALASSGLLNPVVGGESVRPPQPEGIADLVYSFKWEETPGRERYKRGLYLHVQRTAQYPLLMNFDAPDRIASCSRRETSNTPLQALNLMNDPVFVEAAQGLAARVLTEAGPQEAERIDYAYQIALTRKPSAKERDAMSSYLARRRQLSGSIATHPIPDLTQVPAAEAAAWLGASRVLLNLDEFLSRE